jgi:hypothetical protein
MLEAALPLRNATSDSGFLMRFLQRVKARKTVSAP